MASKYGFLGHSYSTFSKNNILRTTEEFGLSSRSALESHLWVYELCSQIQKRAGSTCVLKGGACAQLYLPLYTQRCTLDLDMSTTLKPGELWRLMDTIATDFNKENLPSSFREYTPRFAGSLVQLPMKTYLYSLPFIYKRDQEGDHADIKIDFLFFDSAKLTHYQIPNCKTFGMKLKYSPLSLSPYAIISNKLLTLAASYTGISNGKIESFYKNIYDLYYLINQYNDIESLYKVASLLQENSDMEFEMKGLPPVDIILILKNILITLYGIFIQDLLTSVPKVPFRLAAFEERCLQSSIRSILNLDKWAIMAMYTYIWTFTLYKYMEEGTIESLTKSKVIADSYEYYKTLEKYDRRKLMKSLKKEIFHSDNSLDLSRGIDPLRIIYLHFILSKLDFPL